MPRRLVRSAAVVLVLACAGCGSVGSSVEYGIILQDRYDLQTCTELKNTQNSLAGREKDLVEQIKKAEETTQGVVFGGMAYRSELMQTRGQIRFAGRSAHDKGCDAPAASAPPKR